MSINVYAIVTPAVLALVLLEFLYCLKKRNGYYRFQDSIANLGTALGNQCVNVLVAFLVFRFYQHLAANYSFFKLRESGANYLLLYMLIDFLFYWFHRMGHTINILWAAHMPHHSTEEMNYTVALRASLTQRLASFFFYWPLALLGFAPAMILTTVAVHLVMQIIPHTRVIPKLGPFWESFMNTPSHHRVHHGCNKKYRNKNFGGTFIFWDKLFGTFVAEEDEPYYGVTVGPKTWDPTEINFQYWKQLAREAGQAPYWLDKVKLWFMPIGWTPRGVEPPRPKQEPAAQVKFQTRMLPKAKYYLLAQLAPGFALMLLITRDDSILTGAQKAVLTLLLWAMITVWAGLLESKRWAVPLELARLAATAAFLSTMFPYLKNAAIGAALLCGCWLILIAAPRESGLRGIKALEC